MKYNYTKEGYKNMTEAGDQHPSYGLQWWFNLETKEAKKFKECPGSGWRKGRK